MAKLATFQEDWNTAKSPLWEPWDDDPDKYVQNGVLNLRCTTGYVGMGSVAQNYDFTSSSFTFTLPTPPATKGSQLGVYVQTSSRNVGFTFEFDTLVSWIGDDATDQAQAMPAGAKWFRFRESGGSVFHEWSTDGGTWNTVRTSTTPAGASTSAGIGMFAGSFQGVDGDLVTLDKFNIPPATGAAGTAALSGAGTLAVSSAVATIQGQAAFSATGSLDASVTISTTGQAAFSGAGTLTGSGVYGYAVTIGLVAEGTLSAVGSPRFADVAAFTGAGVLEAFGVAAIAAEAQVALRTLWLNDGENPGDVRSFPTLSALTVTQSKEGEVRRYATGRLRSISKAGSKAVASVTLSALSRSDVEWLENHRGVPVAVRDHVGRKLYAVFFEVPAAERSYSLESDVTLTLTEVTRTEAV